MRHHASLYQRANKSQIYTQNRWIPKGTETKQEKYSGKKGIDKIFVSPRVAPDE